MTTNKRDADDEIKRTLRAAMAARRDAMPPDEQARRSAELCRVADELALDPLRAQLGRPLAVALYAAFRSEANPLELARRCWAAGDTVVAPRIVGSGADKRMELRIVREAADWRPGRWGIPEPDPAVAALRPVELALDVVFVPGLAFDRSGRRLGYGGGFYDRLHAAERQRVEPPARWYGLAYELQVSDEPLPTEPHDLSLDGLVTEAGMFRWTGEG